MNMTREFTTVSILRECQYMKESSSLESCIYLPQKNIVIPTSNFRNHKVNLKYSKTIDRNFSPAKVCPNSPKKGAYTTKKYFHPTQKLNPEQNKRKTRNTNLNPDPDPKKCFAHVWNQDPNLKIQTRTWTS